MGTVLETKPTTTLAAYLDLEDDETRISKIDPSCPSCRCSRNSGRDCSAISRPPKRNLSRTARVIVFGTILIKRVRERRSNHQQKSDRRKRSSSLDSGSSPVGGIYQKNRDNQLVGVEPSGSSQSFPISISKPKISEKKASGSGTIGARQGSCYAFNSGIGLLLVSFGVTVMQGRVIAILITSIWVYFFAWMHMEDRWLRKKPTEFAETEVRDTLRSGCRNTTGPLFRV
ncbi:uncharacterized protein LOC111449019 [Cucurbita moschata]|uniref:Uncharacterized protein LOC111449019 n=1 Tax=Cucurbita moschata TaxID=3662 RepID=A0A6J1FY81_CUCMO|nr:uncharacterized protein LOC111449019 [Cucurbita moschata]